MSTPPLIYLEDVYKSYPGRTGGTLTVLNDIDLKVSSGEFVTIVGPSGCGKSTLLRLLLGSEGPDSGTVLFDGHPIRHPERSRGIVFQKYSLFPHLTVIDNLAFGLDMEAYSQVGRLMNPLGYGRARTEFRKRAQTYLERVGLGQHGEKYPHELSGGMQQRVAIAQGLIMKPKLLMMDEPFGALDDSTRQDMQLYILEQWQTHKMTVFFVTHDLEEAVFLGTRILVLSQYYQSDCDHQAGAKIVCDIPTPGPHPQASNFKYSPEANELIKKIRHDGLEPAHRRHISEFDLRHRDSFRTVKEDEWHDRP
jgi:NitT/TauT family transport system ATP-binding protein